METQLRLKRPGRALVKNLHEALKPSEDCDKETRRYLERIREKGELQRRLSNPLSCVRVLEALFNNKDYDERVKDVEVFERRYNALNRYVPEHKRKEYEREVRKFKKDCDAYVRETPNSPTDLIFKTTEERFLYVLEHYQIVQKSTGNGRYAKDIAEAEKKYKALSGKVDAYGDAVKIVERFSSHSMQRLAGNSLRTNYLAVPVFNDEDGTQVRVEYGG